MKYHVMAIFEMYIDYNKNDTNNDIGYKNINYNF